MKANLIFNLNEDREEFELVLKASNYYSCLWEFDQYLRSELKYKDLSDQEYEIKSIVREELYRIMNDNDINL